LDLGSDGADRGEAAPSLGSDQMCDQ
jgi:hypothetical protein